MTLSLVSGTAEHSFGTVRAIASNDFRRGDEVEAILGRDVLNRCAFQYVGTGGTFELFF